MKTKVIAVVGNKSSGKTTAIENMTRELTKRGYKVATIKHVSEPNFTIDTEGKDTWRFAKAGAKTIISVGSVEVATIEKTGSERISLQKVLKKCKGNDVVFIEGFRKNVGKKNKISKIVVVKSKEEALEALKTIKPILAFTGPYSTKNLNLKIPYINTLKKTEKIVDIIKKSLNPR